MKLLLDEDLDVKLRFRFGPAHEVLTVRQMKWTNRTNKELLVGMLEAGFEVLVTGDKTMRYQHNWQRYPLPILLLDVTPRTYDNLLALIPQALALLAQPSLPGGLHTVAAK